MDSWVNEEECPYTEVKPFTWWRSYQLGGRSLLWGRQSYRWSDLDFEANAKDGVAIDWPIRYKDVAPWYDYVEKFAGISGSKEGLAHLPDGHFLPPMDLNCVEKDVAARFKAKFNDSRHLIIGRVANLTAAIPGRTACQFRNRCWEGCPLCLILECSSTPLLRLPWDVLLKPCLSCVGGLRLRLRRRGQDTARQRVCSRPDT